MESAKSGEVSYDAAKHQRVRKGGVVGSKDGTAATITYEQPKDSLFDTAAVAKMTKAEHAQMVKEAIGSGSSGNKA